MTSQAFSLPNLEGRQKHQADEAVCHDLEGDRAEGEQATEGGLSSAGIQATWPRFFCGPHGREAELGASSGVPRRADRPPHAIFLWAARPRGRARGELGRASTRRSSATCV